MRRVFAAKGIVVWIYLVNLALALPLTLGLADIIGDSLGHSMAADNLRKGFDEAWYAEFKTEATGLAVTFDPTVIGPGALYNGLDAFLSGKIFGGYPAVLVLGVIYLLTWTFFAGGALSLYVSAERLSREAFFASGARYFPRLLRLAIFAGILYFVIYRYVLPAFGDLIARATRDVIDERVAFLWTAGKYATIGLLLVVVNVVFDYSKILTVAQRRRSMLLAVIRAVQLIVKNPGRVFGLYFLVAGIGLLILWVYSLMPTKPWEQTWRGVTVTLIAGQVYIVSRILVRLLFYGGQVVLCESLLGPADNANNAN